MSFEADVHFMLEFLFLSPPSCIELHCFCHKSCGLNQFVTMAEKESGSGCRLGMSTIHTHSNYERKLIDDNEIRNFIYFAPVRVELAFRSYFPAALKCKS